MFRIIVLAAFTLFVFLPQVNAKYDPLSVPNNKYGIHVADPNDIADTPPLVNSSGGDWGYVTVVIQDNDRTVGKWQQIFDQMRRAHLIPLVRLATHSIGDSWAIPTPEDAARWADFLHQLNWPIENRYVILFNEPNHAKEWGGTIDPEAYADIFMQYASALREKSDDFFILPAGLDSSARSDGLSLDAADYIRRMIGHNNAVVSAMDGWTSHAYPNPAFSASPLTNGRGTLTSYQWELELLRALGGRNLPIFITETGWVHENGKSLNSSLLSSDVVGQYLQTASTGAWSHPQIAAITPFVFSYQDVPFDHFSWKKLGTHEYYPHYFSYQQIGKVTGEPKQRHSFSLVQQFFATTMIQDSIYKFHATVKNDGQSILTATDFRLTIDNQNIPVVFESLPTLEPGESGELIAHARAPIDLGEYSYVITLSKGSDTINLEKGTVRVIPPPKLVVTGQLGWRTTSTITDVSILIYDENDLVFERVGLSMEEGTVHVDRLVDIVPGKTYRVVILAPDYLPQQTFAEFAETTTHVAIGRLFPFDYDRDGTLSIGDIGNMLTRQPHAILGLFIGR